jgi:hypothetical protein
VGREVGSGVNSHGWQDGASPLATYGFIGWMLDGATIWIADTSKEDHRMAGYMDEYNCFIGFDAV